MVATVSLATEHAAETAEPSGDRGYQNLAARIGACATRPARVPRCAHIERVIGEFAQAWR